MRRKFTVAALLLCLWAMAAVSSCSKTDSEGIDNEGEQASYETVATEMHCTDGDIDIFGMMYTPKGREERLPVIVLSHSSSLTHKAMAPYAEYLAEKGYAAYCFDFCGACDDSKSTGRAVEEMTVFTEVADLGIVLDRIRSLDYVDADNVFALGSSQGGLVTALLAEERPEDIKGMILFYPAFNIPEIVEKFSSIAGNGGFFGGFGGFGLSDAFVDSVKDYDVYAHIGKYPGDIIILHGTKDFLVDIKYSEKAVETYPSAVLYPIQGANHGFNNENLSGMASMTGGEKDSVVMPYVFDYLAGHIR